MHRLLAFLLLAAAPVAARAHELRIERGDGGFVLRYGHAGGPALPIDRAKIRSLRCVTGNGPPRNVLPVAVFQDTAVRLPSGDCGVLAAFQHGGFYCLTPDGEKPLPKRRCPEAVKAWESRQFAKWVDVRSPVAGAGFGEEFEIVPVTPLAGVRRGGKATFRVLFEGAPVSGAVLAIGHRALGETDSKGEVRVMIRGEKMETVTATLRRKARSEDADQEVYEASLTFEVAR